MGDSGTNWYKIAKRLMIAFYESRTGELDNRSQLLMAAPTDPMNGNLPDITLSNTPVWGVRNLKVGDNAVHRSILGAFVSS